MVPAPKSPLSAFIFDLGDVLFTWSSNTTTNISSKFLRSILSSPTWFDYECGRISREACYQKVANEFSLKASQVAEAFGQAHDSLKPDESIVALLRSLKSGGKFKIFAMSNVGKEDFAALADRMDWSLFDDVFISGKAGMRKPDKEFFRYVLTKIEFAPEQVVFIDDKQENVRAAEELGINGVVFDESTVQHLKGFIDDPVSRGMAYLRRNARQFDSVTDTGVSVPDNFANLLILEVTQDPELVKSPPYSEGTCNFFADGKATLVPGGYFPDDLDTTALALMVKPPKKSTITTALLDKMAECVNSDGSILTYFDRSRPRTDAVVSANVLTCFYRFGRGPELAHTLKYVCSVLADRSYLQGTRYYPSPDCCLGFFGRLLNSAPNDGELQSVLRPLLGDCVKERVGRGGNALELAMRISLCNELGIACLDDLKALLSQQLDDGGWPAGWMYRYGSTGVSIGNRGLTTALALRATMPSDKSGKYGGN